MMRLSTMKLREMRSRGDVVAAEDEVVDKKVGGR